MTKQTKRKRLLLTLGALAVVAVAVVCAVLWMGSALAAPAQCDVGLRPIDHIRHVQCPVLIVAGTDDMRTTIQESRDLYGATPEPKDLWEVAGAAHVDFHRHAGVEYEKRILAFLSRCMGRNG